MVKARGVEEGILADSRGLPENSQCGWAGGHLTPGKASSPQAGLRARLLAVLVALGPYGGLPLPGC